MCEVKPTGLDPIYFFKDQIKVKAIKEGKAYNPFLMAEKKVQNDKIQKVQKIIENEKAISEKVILEKQEPISDTSPEEKDILESHEATLIKIQNTNMRNQISQMSPL